jgi:lysophospholipase L1-like esterase
MPFPKSIIFFAKTWIVTVLLLVMVAGLSSCNKNNDKIRSPGDNGYSITGETIALSGHSLSYLLKNDAKVNAVYKIGKDNAIIHYKAGVDYVLTGNGGVQRTAGSSIPDFSTQKVILNADGKFTFAPDPNRNPQPSILWQVMVDYTTLKDSLITAQSSFISNKLKNKLKNKEDISIYCIGTSISAGANTVPVFYDGKNTVAYVQLMAKAITALYGNKVTVTNLAESGADAILFTSKLDQIKAAKPDLIFVEFGMNEHILSGNMDTYLNAIEHGIKTLTADGIDCSLVGFFQQNPLWEAEVPASTIYFNNKLREMGTRNNVFFADIYNVFAQLPREKLYKDLTGDYMHHPTDFGHKIYYLAIVPLILFDDKKESELLKIVQ